ncbi:putative porin [Flavobacterium filum]|mgnify:CR=1 FL=1|uniref:putative porin n=1 Tax=Flavobacterium filum TaxID=370974 RepID=UPI000421BC42|nr:putative porin [Flavobacterium filum]
MKYFSYIFFLFFFVSSFSQVRLDKSRLDAKDLQKANEEKSSSYRNDTIGQRNSSSVSTSNKNAPKAKIDQYKIITIERDTLLVDTALTIQKEYQFNLLRKDIFGLLPFANEGQTYTTLDFSLNEFQSYPEIGLRGKHFNFLNANDIQYYHVPTPHTELYFKTVMEQGQSLNAFITLNTSERLNFSLAYKGLRSLGKYINQLTSSGNFRFTTNYQTKQKQYELKAHFTAQDILNGENGGIFNIDDFTSGNEEFRNRPRLQVYLNDAKTFLKGNRYFIDHRYRIDKEDSMNNLFIHHQFNYEHKFYEYNQATIATEIVTPDETLFIQRFGSSYALNNINDQLRYNRLFNKIGVNYENKQLGELSVFVENFNYNYFYNRVIINENGTIPNRINDDIFSIGTVYLFQKNKWNGKALYKKSITNQDISELDIKLAHRINDKNTIQIRFQNLNRIPDHTYTLFQSNFEKYNWFNNFKNEKITNIEGALNTQWVNLSLNLNTINDYLYFSNDDSTGEQLLVTPKQYSNTINYLGFKAQKEFKWWKLAMDNTILYQKVDQKDNVLNVPELTLRHSLYISEHFFKKALYLQTGFVVNYFSSYNADDYNPVISAFYVQNKSSIGDFPLVDFFVNAKIKQAQVYLKAEHFNSAMTGFDYFSAPNYPYRDFIVRFGLIWNFFQ